MRTHSDLDCPRAARLGAAVVAIAISVATLVTAPVARADDSARALVERAATRLVNGLAERGEAIRADPTLAWRLAEETVFPLVDFDRVGRLVLGVHGRGATPQARDAFLAAFERHAREFIVSAMVAYSRDIARHADRIRFPAPRDDSRADATDVVMEIDLDTGATVEVKFRMRRTASGWHAHDVALAGVSLVLLHRRGISVEVRRDGLPAVIERLQGRG